MKTSAEKMAEFSKRRKDAGIVQISTWVPAARRADILRLAQAWREGSLFTLPDDLGAVTIDRPGIAIVTIGDTAGIAIGHTVNSDSPALVVSAVAVPVADPAEIVPKAKVARRRDVDPADAPDPRQADIDDILGGAPARPAPSPGDATPMPASRKGAVPVLAGDTSQQRDITPKQPPRRGPAPAPEAVVRQRIAYGKAVRAAREAKGLTPAELGRRLGYGGVLRVEQGKNFPPPAIQAGIARLLGVKP